MSGDVTENRIYFDMLKIMSVDIAIYNHLFDLFNKGPGLHGEFAEIAATGVSSYDLPIFVKAKLFR